MALLVNYEKVKPASNATFSINKGKSILKGLRKMYSIQGAISGCVNYRSLPRGEKYTRLDFVLRSAQLIELDYPLPLPLKNVTRKKWEFMPTATLYQPLTPRSKMFAIDCEMCGTAKDSRALTRIAVVDEDLNTVYETLVKPPDPIRDYRTHLSGITPWMMEGVNVTVKDVQEKIKEIVEEYPDCILVGHSLNYDLRAIGMTHPYVIDTCVLFTEDSTRKPSLEKLSRKVLRQKIQRDCHSPEEDAVAAMKLVKRVLKQGTIY